VGLNIKNEEANRLIHELAGATGESLTTAVTIAVRERLERIQQREPGDLAKSFYRSASFALVISKSLFAPSSTENCSMTRRVYPNDCRHLRACGYPAR
jgi:hypothetical protein